MLLSHCSVGRGNLKLKKIKKMKKRKPSGQKFSSPLSAEFWRHCALSGGTQRRALRKNN